MAATPPTAGREPPFRIELAEPDDGRYTVVRVHGEVDVATVGQLARAVHHAVGSRTGTVICDLRQVAFLSVAGLRCLEAAAHDLHLQHRTFRIVVAEQHRLPGLVVMAQALPRPFHHSVEEAARSAAAAEEAGDR